MKKIVDKSEYPEQLGFLPDILAPLMQAVKDKLHASIPTGVGTVTIGRRKPHRRKILQQGYGHNHAVRGSCAPDRIPSIPT